MKDTLQELYIGRSASAKRFRYGVFAFDIVTILFLVVSSFFPDNPIVEWLDVAIGSVILVDFIARLWIANDRTRFVFSFHSLLDIIVIASLLAPLVGEGLAFLRILRALRVLKSPQLLQQLRHDVRWFARNDQSVAAGINLLVFVFIMTAIVYETQHWHNPKIEHYFDAFYFTITALTTTGFGDITLEGDSGRLLAIIIMIAGVSLFIRLVQTLLRPDKVIHPCPSCGLQRHDYDASHCKACGTVINILDDGAV